MFKVFGSSFRFERGNPLLPHGLLLPISSKGYFICTIPTDRIAHTTAFVKPVVEHWVEREIACYDENTKIADRPREAHTDVYRSCSMDTMVCCG